MLEAVARSGARLVVPVLGVVEDAEGEVWPWWRSRWLREPK